MTADQLLPASTDPTGLNGPPAAHPGPGALAGAGAGGRPLAATAVRTRDAVHRALDAGTVEADYMAIARLSGHLAAMRRTAYRPAAGAAAPLRAACLARAREVEWALRLLECHLAGEASALGWPATAAARTLAQRLARYWPAEQALVTWVEEGLAAGDRAALAERYRRALAGAPTRPHPRCPRSGLLAPAALWLASRWDRVLDTMDSRCGVGQDFRLLLAAPPAAGEAAGAAPAAGPGAPARGAA